MQSMGQKNLYQEMLNRLTVEQIEEMSNRPLVVRQEVKDAMREHIYQNLLKLDKRPKK